MAVDSDHSTTFTVSTALCIAPEAFERFGSVLRYLAVGLVDQAIRLRLVSSEPRVELLALGPIKTVVHPPLGWPLGQGRMRKVLEQLQPDPPTTVHAMSARSYSLASSMAEEFDADLFLQVASMDDCKEIANLSKGRIGGFLVSSQPFAGVLEHQLGVAGERIHLIRPGLPAAQRPACFPNEQRTATLLCTSPLQHHSGIDLLINAVELLRQREWELLLFLLGKGPRESALRRMIRQRNLSSVITFAHPLGDVGNAMVGADLFIHPSSDTGFTVDSLQAMAAGMVVVAFPSAVCDHLRNGETAALCEKRTPQALADVIEQLLKSRDAARKIASAGIAYARRNHAMSGMAERTAELYRQSCLARATFPIAE